MHLPILLNLLRNAAIYSHSDHLHESSVNMHSIVQLRTDLWTEVLSCEKKNQEVKATLPSQKIFYWKSTVMYSGNRYPTDNIIFKNGEHKQSL
jgi:hypothetical protein